MINDDGVRYVCPNKRRLPPGWKKATANGKTYYYNKKLGQVTITRQQSRFTY